MFKKFEDQIAFTNEFLKTIDTISECIIYVVNPQQKLPVNKWYIQGTCRQAIGDARYLAKNQNRKIYVMGYSEEDKVDLGAGITLIPYKFPHKQCVKYYFKWLEYTIKKFNVVYINFNIISYAAPGYIKKSNLLNLTTLHKLIWTIHIPDCSFVGYHYKQDYIDYYTEEENADKKVVVFVSNYQKDTYLKDLKIKPEEVKCDMKVIYNNLFDNTEFFVSHVENKKYDAIVVGRSEPTRAMLQSVALCKEMGFKILHIGAKSPVSPDDKYHKEVLSLLGPEDTHLEECPNEEVLKYMSESLYFVFLSKIETFGIVVIEALSQGCRPICSHVGGVGEILDKIEVKGVDYRKGMNKNTVYENIRDMNKTYSLEKVYSSLGKYFSSTAKFNQLREIYKY